MKDIKSFYKNYLVWLCCQSEANLSLPAIWEMQGDFAELQGRRRLVPAEDPGISMGWIGVSLTQEQGDPHSIAGKVDLETPRQRFHAAHFNVRFRHLSGIDARPLHSGTFSSARSGSPQSASILARTASRKRTAALKSLPSARIAFPICTKLLRLAGVSTERSAARRWLERALAAARGAPERRLVPQPSPARCARSAFFRRSA